MGDGGQAIEITTVLSLIAEAAALFFTKLCSGCFKFLTGLQSSAKNEADSFLPAY